MQKVQRSDITTQPQFSFAHEYLKSQVMKIATEFGGNPDSDDVNEKANNHFKMVAKIVKTYMTIIESFTEADLKKLSSQENNLEVLNRFLALRQLSETQLMGVLQGTWGIPPNITSGDEFQALVANSDSTVTRAQLWSSVKDL